MQTQLPLPTLLDEQLSEEILNPSRRNLAFKVNDTELWNLYERQFECFWQPKEIEPAKDRGWDSLRDNERELISMILAFFATADSIVFDNLNTNFSSEVVLTEAKYFYGMQGFMENIHSQVYMSLLTTYVQDPIAQARLIDAINVVPTIKRKGDWACKYFSNEIPFCMRLIAFSIVEGVFFSSAFASIFWLKKYKKGILDALTLSNSFIARDEGLHTEFAVALFHRLKRIPLQSDVHSCFQEAIELEMSFVKDVLEPRGVVGMDANALCEYVRFTGDRLLQQLGYETLFNVKENPLSFMETQSMRVSTNFFEAKVHEYALAQVGAFAENEEF